MLVSLNLVPQGSRRRYRSPGRATDAIAAAIAPHVRAGWRIEIVPLYYPRDVAQAQDLADLLPRGAAVTVVDAALDWDALLDRLATVDLVVTMRFHALAAALIDERPAFAIAYESKVAALAARTGTPVVLVDDPRIVDSLGTALAGAIEPASPDAAARRTTARNARRPDRRAALTGDAPTLECVAPRGARPSISGGEADHPATEEQVNAPGPVARRSPARGRAARRERAAAPDRPCRWLSSAVPAGGCGPEARPTQRR
jgi:hypothetical protein